MRPAHILLSSEVRFFLSACRPSVRRPSVVLAVLRQARFCGSHLDLRTPLLLCSHSLSLSRHFHLIGNSVNAKAYLLLYLSYVSATALAASPSRSRPPICSSLWGSHRVYIKQGYSRCEDAASANRGQPIKVLPSDATRELFLASFPARFAIGDGGGGPAFSPIFNPTENYQSQFISFGHRLARPSPSASVLRGSDPLAE